MKKTAFIEDDAKRYEHMLTQLGLAPATICADDYEIQHNQGGAVVVIEWTKFLGDEIGPDGRLPRVRMRTTIKHEAIEADRG